MDEQEDSSKGNSVSAIRKNMVRTRTQLFESGDAGTGNEDIKAESESSSKPSKPAESLRPQITAPKPKLPSSFSPAKPDDKSHQEPPNFKSSVARKTALFEGDNKGKHNSENSNVSHTPKEIGHRRVLSDQDPQKFSPHVSNEILTEAQVVRPKTKANTPVYAQVDLNRKSVNKNRPPKPSIPKIDRMRGKIPSDTHRYDGVVVGPVDPLPNTPDTAPLTPPPAKPPRTFAHDEYLKNKAEKKKQLNAKLTEIVAEESESDTVTNTVKDRNPKRPDPSSKPPLPKDTKPPPKPKRPDRPPSLNEKDKQSALQLSSSSHAYEDIDNIVKHDPHFLLASTDSQGYHVINGREKNVASGNGKTCHYEEIDSPAFRDSPNITVRKKPKRAFSNPDGQMSTTLRPKTKPPPPPRPPMPSSEDGGSTKTEDDSRWNHGFVRVVRHNPNLTDEDFIKDTRLQNPNYGKKHSIITGKIMGEEAGLKRFKSDECLYAEVDEIKLKNSEPVYHDPVDCIPTSHGQKGHLTEHGVVVDSEGYAIPDTGHHSADRKLGGAFRKNIRRSGTIASGNRPNFLERTPPHGKSPISTAINKKRSPQVRERLSRAYSVLRKRPSLDGTDAAPASLHCVPEDEDDSDQEVDLEEQKKRLQYVVSVKESRYGTLSNYASYRPRRKSRELYSYALIVGLQQQAPDSHIYKPQVLFTHPKEAVPEHINVIADFCFPDATIWRPVTQYTSESFSFVLTNNEGQRQYGYCRRILPPGTGNRLPEVYCVVTDVGAWSLYGQLLDDAERKRQHSMLHVQDLLIQGLKATLPAPGKEAWISAMAANSSKETLILKRSADCRQEKVSFETLVKKLSVENLLKVFASILLERRIIFVGQHLSTLTCCIHAVVSLLYPFEWPHTFVPILPAAMLDICCSPTPYIAGILTASQPRLAHMDMEKVLQVDLDNNCLLDQVGDESRIIPRKLHKALSTALKEDNTADSSVSGGSRDVMVFEAFLRMFVETVGHFSDYIFQQQDGKEIFLREQFITAVNSKSIRLFLEWFTETQMFDTFINKHLEEGEDATELFTLRIEEYRQEMADMSPSLRENLKEVGRKMFNFFVESGAKVKKALHSNHVFV